jgi:aryl-alcohol dehydrogenase-like predicted oxidoreductase
VADLDPSDYPVAPIVKAALERGEALTPDTAARDIWASLPPPTDQSVLLFGAPPTGVTTTSLAARAVGAYVDLINARRYDEIGDLFAADGEFLAPTGETLRGREAIRAFYSSALRQIAPEEVWVHSAVAEGNRCVIEISARLPGEPAGSSHVVVDHFTVDAAGLVTRLAVYLRPAEQRETNARGRCPMTAAPVQHRVLGRTGLQVSPLCLGTMAMGSFGNADHDDCIRIIHRALDAGINIVDTADVYSAGESETIVGEALRRRRDDVILATKCHFPLAGISRRGVAANSSGNSRRHIVNACEASLRRLQTDWIDLLQLHRPDPNVPIEESLAALTDLQRAGKIRAFGCSTFPADHVVEAAWMAERHGLSTFATEQPPYSIVTRWAERDLLPAAQRLGMGTLVWGPLDGGWLAGKYRAGETPPENSRAARWGRRFDLASAAAERKTAIVAELEALASKAATTLPRLAIAWVLNNPAVTCAIVGPRTLDQLESQLGADELRLDDEVLDVIDELVAPGTSVGEEKTRWIPPALADPSVRRR